MLRSIDIGGNDGFTLVETIIAFVILSLTLVIAVHTISISLSKTQRARVEMQIRNIARSVLAETLPLRHGSLGRSGRHGDTYRWRLDIKPLNPGVAADRMHHITLEISHEIQPKMSSVFTTFEPMTSSAR